MLASLNLGKTIPVGNSDAGSYFSNKVLESVDYGVRPILIPPHGSSSKFFLQLSNVHAWFANTTIEEASPWVTKFFEETNVQPAALLPNKASLGRK